MRTRKLAKVRKAPQSGRGCQTSARDAHVKSNIRVSVPKTLSEVSVSTPKGRCLISVSLWGSFYGRSANDPSRDVRGTRPTATVVACASSAHWRRPRQPQIAEATSSRATIINTMVIVPAFPQRGWRGSSIRLASANGVLAILGVESVQLGLDRPSNFRLGSGYPTHVVAQMRRAVIQRGLDRQPIEPRAEQRFPEIAPETVLEEVSGAVVA